MANELQLPLVRLWHGMAASIFTLGAPVSGFFLTRIFLEARANADWPSTDGTLTRVAIREVAGRYSSDVSYTYAIDESSYVGSLIRASDGENRDPRSIERKLAGLQEGSQVRVYYDPVDPACSLLRVGLTAQEYVLLIVPLVMLAIGVFGFSLLWRTRRVSP